MPNQPSKAKYRARDEDGCDRREAEFARYYIRFRSNGPRAASSAGYRGDVSRRASALIKRPQVLRAIRRLTVEALENTTLSAERVVVELARIATADCRACFDENGKLIPLADLPADVAAAIWKFEVDEDYKPTLKKVEFHSKPKALGLLLQFLGAKGRIPDTVTEPLLKIHWLNKGNK